MPGAHEGRPIKLRIERRPAGEAAQNATSFCFSSAMSGACQFQMRLTAGSLAMIA